MRVRPSRWACIQSSESSQPENFPADGVNIVAQFPETSCDPQREVLVEFGLH